MKLSVALLNLIVCVNFVFGISLLPYEHGIKLNSAAVQQHGLEKGSKLLEESSDKGEKSERKESGFAKDEDRKYEKSEADGAYKTEDHEKKVDEEGAKYDNEKFHQLEGGSLSGIEKKTGHKKGHHKTGFHNTYHKDESGGNSSYYDGANDEADERYLSGREGHYGNAGHNANHGAHVNDNRYLKDSQQHGGYDKGNRYNKEHGNSRNYNQNQYNDDRNIHAHNNVGNRYDERALAAIEQRRYPAEHQRYGDYVAPVGAYNDYRAPYPTIVKPVYEPSRDRKITIYEDPRYESQPGFNGGYYDDRIDYQPARNSRYPVPRYPYY